MFGAPLESRKIRPSMAAASDTHSFSTLVQRYPHACLSLSGTAHYLQIICTRDFNWKYRLFLTNDVLVLMMICPSDFQGLLLTDLRRYRLNRRSCTCSETLVSKNVGPNGLVVINQEQVVLETRKCVPMLRHEEGNNEAFLMFVDIGKQRIPCLLVVPVPTS